MALFGGKGIQDDAWKKAAKNDDDDEWDTDPDAINTNTITSGKVERIEGIRNTREVAEVIKEQNKFRVGNQPLPASPNNPYATRGSSAPQSRGALSGPGALARPSPAISSPAPSAAPVGVSSPAAPVGVSSPAPTLVNPPSAGRAAPSQRGVPPPSGRGAGRGNPAYSNVPPAWQQNDAKKKEEEAKKQEEDRKRQEEERKKREFDEKKKREEEEKKKREMEEKRKRELEEKKKREEEEKRRKAEEEKKKKEEEERKRKEEEAAAAAAAAAGHYEGGYEEGGYYEEGSYEEGYYEEGYEEGYEQGGYEQSYEGGIQCRALYDYESQQEGDLNFYAGDIIHIIDQSDPSGWWHGEINGVSGYFPSNFVEQL